MSVEAETSLPFITAPSVEWDVAGWVTSFDPF